MCWISRIRFLRSRWYYKMKSLILRPRPSFQWRCLLLVFMTVSAGATPEEGAHLLNWRNNMTHPGKLVSWGVAGSSDPCHSNSSWLHVSCDTSGFVQRLDLGSSELSGPLASELGLFSKLEVLDLDNNSFSGRIPPELGNLAALTTLKLSENQLSGSIPDTFVHLTNLKDLTLHNNKLSGSFPESLTLLPELSLLNLDSNLISGMLNVTRLFGIIQATSQPLRALSLMNNNITDVDYPPGNLLTNETAIKLQGNPYCSGSKELYDDGKRCFCEQNCLISQEGNILWNWKNKLRNSSIYLPNWVASTDPCGNNPWFHVICNDKKNVIRIDLGNSSLSGPLVPELGQLSNLSTLTFYSNFLYGTIPPELANIPSLNFLDLSHNLLSGPIPDTFGNLKELAYLRLNNNNLSGSFPESLTRDFNLIDIQLGNNFISGVLNYTRVREIVVATARMNQGQSISGIVSLMNNSITDVVYQPDDFQNAGVRFRLEGNPYCNDSTKVEDFIKRCFCQQDCLMMSTVKKSPRLAIIIGTSSCAVLLFLLGCFGVLVKRRAKRKLHELEVQYQNKFAKFEVNPQLFLYNELRLATQDFNQSTKLGQGSFGTVYKGVLLNGNEVAIKKLEPKVAAHGEIDDFLNEVVFITKMKHRNLVDLKGYCMRGKERMLVYEYIENMDVEQCLLMGKNKEAMTWNVRFNICLGVARGLHYLHTYAEPRVIHRDIKASNILLDAHHAPKIADFGLALLFPDEKTHISTANVAGTRGYLAPEYALYGQLSEKADVYSFGVLCLEIIGGRKNIDQSMPPKQVYLPNWAWILYDQGKLKDLIDPSMRLYNNGDEKEVLQLINIALSCLQQNPDKRPSMNEVQMALQGKMNLEEFEYPINESIGSSIVDESEVQSLTSTTRSMETIMESLCSDDAIFLSEESEVIGQKYIGLKYIVV